MYKQKLLEIQGHIDQTSIIGRHLMHYMLFSRKNLPAMQETQVRFLGRKDPLEKEMGTQSSILA